MNTTFEQRFTEAVERLVGAKPPQKFVQDWLAGKDANGHFQLQAWVLNQKGTPHWAQGIVLLDAAELLAETPVEGVGYGVHEPRIKKEEPS